MKLIMYLFFSLLIKNEEFLKKNLLLFTGAYVPITNKGNIIVDEILASCYPSSFDHNLAHYGMAPMRWFPDIMHMMFGEDDTLSVFIRINEELGLWMLPYEQLW